MLVYMGGHKVMPDTHWQFLVVFSRSKIGLRATFFKVRIHFIIAIVVFVDDMYPKFYRPFLTKSAFLWGKL